MIPLTRRVGTRLLRWSTVNRAVRALARARGRRLVLVYHRLGPPAPAGCEIVPSVPVEVFRAQLQALGEIVDLVPIDEVLGSSKRQGATRYRPAIAITFDDDLPSHVDHALSVLCGFGVPATFFLSGRALHGLGAYWFQHLEALLVAYGEQRTGALLRVSEVTRSRLILACERDAELRRRVIEVAAGLSTSPVLQPAAIAALATAGMEVGFHTVAHGILPDLDDAALEDAVSRGRAELAAAAGVPVRYFAYPHGKADARSAAAVRRGGFEAAFTGQPRPVRNGDNRYHVGRWEPGPLAVDDLLVNIAVRLHRAGVPGTNGLA